MPARRQRAQSDTAGQLASSFAGDQLYRDLLQFVEESPPHQRIASGRVLSRQYKVSHSTVNAVITRLADEGHVYTVHGKGAFVAEAEPGNSNAKPSATRGETLVYTYVPATMEQAYGARMMHGVVETAQAHDLHLQVWEHSAGRGNMPTHESLCDCAESGVSAFILPWIETHSLERMRQINPTIRVLTTASVKPGQQIASVLLDFVDMGQQAADYLLEHKAKRIAAVYRNPIFGQTVADRLRQTRKAKPLLIEHRNADQTLAACRAILDAKIDGLAFSDDRGALNILRLLVNHDPSYLNKVTVVSHANAGEALLPVPVARLESDGYEIGATAVATLMAMRAGQTFSTAEVRIKSRLIGPDAVSLKPRKGELLDAS